MLQGSVGKFLDCFMSRICVGLMTHDDISSTYLSFSTLQKLLIPLFSVETLFSNL